MASISQSQHTSSPMRAKRTGALEFRITLVAAFFVILAGLLLALPFRLLVGSNSGHSGSVFHVAWEKANACVPFVFMS